MNSHVTMRQHEILNQEVEEGSSLTFREIAYEWLNMKKYRIKNSTYVKYYSLLEKYVLDQFGMVPTGSYTCLLFEKGLQSISNHKQQMSKSLMDTILYLVRSIIKYGYRHSYNAMYTIEFDYSPEKTTNVCSVLDKDDENRLIDYLIQNTSMNNLGIVMSLLTGMRIGEICALKRSDIDPLHKVITITGTAQRIKVSNRTELMVSSPKSKTSIREIPMPDIVYTYISRFELWSLNSEYYILSGKATPYEPRTLQYAFKKSLDICNIQNINFHSLRHTFATNCIELGFDIKTLSELLGHSSVNFTLNRYVHSSITQKRKQMNLINDKYSFLENFAE